MRIIILLILLNITFYSYSQELDKVYLKNKEVISGKILNVTSENIEINPDGSKPFLIIKRNDAKLIIYSDNTIVNFDSPDSRNTQQIKKEKPDATSRINIVFPTTEKNILKCVIDTLKNYENLYNELNFDILEFGSSPFYYKESEILKLKIKNIKTSYTISLKSLSRPLNYKEIWEYSESGKLISETIFRESTKANQSNYEWGSNGKIISSTKYNSGGLFGIYYPLITTFYSYRGDTIIIKKKDENGKLKELSIRLKNIHISMDTEHERIQIKLLQKQDNGFELLSYSYDKNNTFNKYILKYIFNNDKISSIYGSRGLWKEFFYNKDGHLSKYLIYDRKKKYEFEIFYNKKGVVKKTTDYNSKDVRKYSYEFY